VKSEAFYNWGAWKAFCPSPRCTDAVALYPQSPYPPFEISADPVFHQRCARGHEFDIEAPDEDTRARIEVAIGEDSVHDGRTWYPKGHPAAALYHHPSGQSVSELEEETAELRRIHETEESDRNRLRKLLADLGVTVDTDGTFNGRI